MKVRLGYVAIALNLKDASTSRTVTVSALTKIGSREARLYKLRKILEENLSNTLRVLRYNKAYNIYVYRLTSKLVPLATHQISEGWDYIEEFKDRFKEIGDYVKENDMRLSAHPDHFTVINTNSEGVFKASLKDLEYHYNIFDAMGLDNNYKFVLHVGGLYKDKERSKERFIEGYNKLPKEIASRIILENDDKVYNAYDVMEICKKVSIPMVLDVHHHNCNNDGRSIEQILSDIFDTWKGQKFVPKIHFSSPKSDKDFRSHADDISPNEFMEFINTAKSVNRDFDVMLEAKNKDLALIKLIHSIKDYSGVKMLNDSQFRI